MATLEFSSTFNTAAGSGMNALFIGPTTNNTVTNMASTPTATSLMPTFNNTTGNGLMYFHIMQGSVPSDPDTLTSFSARSADVLITWQRAGVSGGAAGMINGNTSNQFSLSSETTSPMTLTTSFQAASANGTATWFWWATRAASGTNGAATDVVYHSIIGTVGTLGSGADLEIGNPVITSGKLYRMINFKIQLPTLVTY